MRMSYALSVVAAIALAACGSDADEAAGEGEAISSDATTSEMAGGDTPRPGQYRTRQELLELEMPGMPEEMMSMMRDAFAQSAAGESTYCLTAEEAGNAREQMLEGMAESECDISRFDMSGGRIDALMTCPSGQGMSGEVMLTGTMNSEGANMEMAYSTEIPGQGTGSLRVRVTSERIGDC